jgi:Plasmid encoded RepA protein
MVSLRFSLRVFRIVRDGIVHHSKNARPCRRSVNSSQSFERCECPLSTCVVKRRRFSSGCKPRPASAPAGSNRRSLRDWLGRIGVSVGGRTGKLVRDQAERISRCRLTFHIAAGLINHIIVDGALFIEEDGGSQGRLSLETAKLLEGFFEQLNNTPFRSRKPPSKQSTTIQRRSIATSGWRAGCMFSRHLGWSGGRRLRAQFGTPYRETHHFKNKWTATLVAGACRLPSANVDVVEGGVILKL